MGNRDKKAGTENTFNHTLEIERGILKHRQQHQAQKECDDQSGVMH
jgi:hypothetical protein